MHEAVAMLSGINALSAREPDLHKLGFQLGMYPFNKAMIPLVLKAH